MRSIRMSMIVVPAILLAFTSSLAAQGRLWRPYAELETRGSNEDWTQQGNLFLPLRETEVNILFADIRGNWTDQQAAHGNFGLAFRQMLIGDMIGGIYGFYDTKYSAFDNHFHRGSLGMELLATDWGVRWNGYYAGEGAKFLPDLNRVSLAGNELLIQRFGERAYSGQDIEFEKLLWYRETPSDGRWRHWVNAQDIELWASIGAFHYDNSSTAYEEISGPRARMELRIYDIPIAGPDSRLVFSGQYEHDDVRGSVGTGLLAVRIPFGRGTDRPRGLLRGLNRRMVNPIMRNTNLISNTGSESSEAAAFAFNGQTISQVLTVDATTVDPDLVIGGAGNNSLVVVDGSAGTILPANSISLADGQVLLGGGGSLTVTGVNSGTSAVFNAPGSRPTIDTVLNSTVLAANNSGIIGMNLANSGPSLSGIVLQDDIGVLINDVSLNLTGNSSLGVEALGASRFAMSDSQIITSGLAAAGMSITGTSFGSISNVSIGTSGSDAEGIRIGENGILNLRGSRIFTSGASGSEGIVATGSAQLIVSRSTITTTGSGTSAVVATPTASTDTLAMTLSGSTINATGDAVVLGGPGFTAGTLNASVTNNAIVSPVGSNEINAETSGTAVTNLSISGNAFDPTSGTIRLSEIGGDLNVSQSAPGTAETGIDVVNRLPATNVLVPGGAVSFDELPPLPPVTP